LTLIDFVIDFARAFEGADGYAPCGQNYSKLWKLLQYNSFIATYPGVE